MKKWKGKDWYVIFSPKMFGEIAVSETPATDPKSLAGRTVEATLAELLGDQRRNFMKVIMKIEEIKGNNAYTRFNGLVTSRDHLNRFIRKRTQKVEIIQDFMTKDRWKIRLKSVAILNRNTEAMLKKKMRKHVVGQLMKKVKSSTIDDLVRGIISGNTQAHIRKTGNKIYPVRFFEISKLEVLSAPKAS